MPPHLCLLGDANSPHTRRWALEMRARGWRVSLVTARPEPLADVEQRILPPVRRQTDWLLRTGAARRHVRDLAPDIVHAHYLTSYGYLAARCGRHPLVMTAWGSDLLVTPHTHPWMHWLTGWILRRADLITGDSASLVEAARQYRPRAPVHEIHWGVDRARFAPTSWEHKDGLHIVSLRAWEPNYQIATLIDAFALLRQQLCGAPLHLHLLGGCELVELLTDACEERKRHLQVETPACATVRLQHERSNVCLSLHAGDGAEAVLQLATRMHYGANRRRLACCWLFFLH